jgi:hypothetical protein
LTGLGSAEFWDLTPRATEAILTASAEVRHNELITLAYMTANFTRAKRLPNIKTLLFRKKARQMASDQMLIMEKWRQRTAHLPPRIQR